MLEEIISNINERLENQPDSRCATADEVRICWLISEIDRLNKIIREQKDSADCAYCKNYMPYKLTFKYCPECGQKHR